MTTEFWETIAVLFVLVASLLIISYQSKADVDPVKVAILDTGVSWHKNVDLCASINLIGDSLDGVDKHGHGTNVSYLIKKHAEGAPHCQLPIKAFGMSGNNKNRNETNMGLKMAIVYGVDIINYSGGGLNKDKEECSLIRLALDKGIKVVASAGNENKDLADQPYYPASCDDRVVVVGCSNLRVSNYGDLDYTYKCKNVGNPSMSGTSQATAIVSGKLVKKLYKERSHESRKSKQGR